MCLCACVCVLRLLKCLGVVNLRGTCERHFSSTSRFIKFSLDGLHEGPLLFVCRSLGIRLQLNTQTRLTRLHMSTWQGSESSVPKRECATAKTNGERRRGKEVGFVFSLSPSNPHSLIHPRTHTHACTRTRAHTHTHTLHPFLVGSTIPTNEQRCGDSIKAFCALKDQFILVMGLAVDAGAEI